MSEQVPLTGSNKSASFFNWYDAGSEAVTTDYSDVVLDQEVQQMLILPKTECLLKLNGGSKEIYLPADIWTPILVRVESFSLKALTDAGTVYWQGWFL